VNQGGKVGMRSDHVSSLGTIVLGALLTLAAGGCSKKTVAPDSQPVPEGQQSGEMIMTGWHEQGSVWFVVTDPGTPDSPNDDVLTTVGADYFADPNGVRTTTFDVSPSNSLEAMRVNADGNVAPLFDFPVPASVRLIGADLDAFDFEDFSPPATPQYYGRGELNGIVTSASPVSNPASAFPTCDESMNFIPEPFGAPNDSVLDVQFEEDPRASFYVVEISDASGVVGVGDVFTNERRARGIPSPLLPGQRPLNSGIILMPAGTGLAGFHVTFSTHAFPLFFHIRVTAIDAQGRMVNRVNDYAHTHQVSGPENRETYEPLGGAVEILDPYANTHPPLPLPTFLSSAQAFALLESFGGTGRPAQVANLGASAAFSNPGAQASTGFTDAMNRLLRQPRFTPEGVRAQIVSIRRGIDAGSGANLKTRVSTAAGVQH
jgi:hypothetical protein